MSIPARLAEAKQRYGLTDIQAGAALNVTQQTFHKWRTGKQRPGEDRLPAIAEWAQVDLVELRAEWHDDRLSGGMSAERAESLGEVLSVIVAQLSRVADRIESAVDAQVGPPDPPASPRRQRVR